MCKQKRTRKPRVGVCQVCCVDLVALKAKDYCFKKRVCPEHLAADAVVLPGHSVMHRFCHQCGRFEPLTCFDGMRRSCRTRLVIRRVGLSSLRKGGRSRSGVAELQQQGSALANVHTATSGGLEAATAGAAAAAAAAAAGAASSAPASSPAMSLNAGASPAPVHSCSVLSVDAAPMQLRDQQVWSHSAAAGVPGMALSSPQQQQQHEGNTGAGFEDFLHGLMEDELQQIMQQEQQGAAQPPASAHLGALSAPVAMQSAVQNPVLLGGCAAGLYRSASTGTAVSSTAPMSLCVDTSHTNRSAVQPLLFSDGRQAEGGHPATPAIASAAALAVADGTALRRQQLLLQAKQLLEEERRLCDLASGVTVTEGVSMTGALLGWGSVGAAGTHSGLVQATTAPVLSVGMPLAGAGMTSVAGFVPMQSDSVTGSLARMHSAPPGALPAAAEHLLASGSLQPQQRQQQQLLPQGAAAGFVGQGGVEPQGIYELRTQLQHAKMQLEELKAAAESIMSVRSLSCDMSYTVV